MYAIRSYYAGDAEGLKADLATAADVLRQARPTAVNLFWAIDETSPDAGGLLRWPIKLAVPVGFGLLWLQGLAEVIKRADMLWGGQSHDKAAGSELS